MIGIDLPSLTTIISNKGSSFENVSKVVLEGIGRIGKDKSVDIPNIVIAELKDSFKMVNSKTITSRRCMKIKMARCA